MHMKAYETLVALSKKAHLIKGIEMLLDWDQETYMPKRAGNIRAEQKKLLSNLSHEIRISSPYTTALSSLIDLETGAILHPELHEAQRDALKVWRHDYLRLKKLPTEFVEKFAEASTKSVFIWEEAKKTNNFHLFLPALEELVSLSRKKADLIGYDEHPYDALIDEFEPGTQTVKIDKLFSQLKQGLLRLFVEVKEMQKNHPEERLNIPLHENHYALCTKALDLINYNWDQSRLDLSLHPFSSACHPHDSRITVRKEPLSIIEEILSALHEAGHSFYEMGLNPQEHGTPLGEAISFGVHESISRWWETRVGRSFPFWKFFYPSFKEALHTKKSLPPLETFYKELLRSKASLIRTESDEITYSFHIILRFNIEKKLIEGSLRPKDIPEMWRYEMQENLNISPQNDSEGCLQDIHWAIGAFGYFPTYTLGNLFCAQLFEAFEKEYPQWPQEIESGNFDFIRAWQQREIFSLGRRLNGFELVEKISGKELSSQPFIEHLYTKYTSVFS